MHSIIGWIALSCFVVALLVVGVPTVVHANTETTWKSAKISGVFLVAFVIALILWIIGCFL